jgi:hypothetical protein
MVQGGSGNAAVAGQAAWRLLRVFSCHPGLSLDLVPCTIVPCPAHSLHSLAPFPRPWSGAPCAAQATLGPDCALLVRTPCPAGRMAVVHVVRRPALHGLPRATHQCMPACVCQTPAATAAMQHGRLGRWQPGSSGRQGWPPCASQVTAGADAMASCKLAPPPHHMRLRSWLRGARLAGVLRAGRSGRRHELAACARAGRGDQPRRHFISAHSTILRRCGPTQPVAASIASDFSSRAQDRAGTVPMAPSVSCSGLWARAGGRRRPHGAPRPPAKRVCPRRLRACVMWCRARMLRAPTTSWLEGPPSPAGSAQELTQMSAPGHAECSPGATCPPPQLRRRAPHR